MRSINEKVLSDSEKARPETDTGRRFFNCGHFKYLAHLPLPDATDLEYDVLLGIAGECRRDTIVFGRIAESDDRAAEDHVSVVPLNLDAGFRAIARNAADNRKKHQGGEPHNTDGTPRQVACIGSLIEE